MEIFKYKDLVKELVVRDIKVKYKIKFKMTEQQKHHIQQLAQELLRYSFPKIKAQADSQAFSRLLSAIGRRLFCCC